MSTSSKTSVAVPMMRDRPPVAMTGQVSAAVRASMSSASSASCDLMRATSPSACAASPSTRPDWMACSVVSPMAAGGTSMGVLASLAARAKSAEAESMRPGAMQPPR